MAQVSIIGGGNVGANAAFFVAEKGVTDVLLVDVQPGLSRGKMLDIMEAAPNRRYRNFLSGSDSLADIAGSELRRRGGGRHPLPGHAREDLFTVNAGLVRSLAPEIARLAPDSIVVIATEPVDGLTTLSHAGLGVSPTACAGSRRHPGLHAPARADRAGAAHVHGDRLRIGDRAGIRTAWSAFPGPAAYAGLPLPHLLPSEKIASLVEETRTAGDLVVELAKRSSAYYSPSAAIAELTPIPCT